jgi:hypothetical protein
MQGPSQFALGTLATDRCDVDLDRFSGRLGDSDLSDAYGVTDDVVRQLDADETEEFVRLVNANGDDALRLAQRAVEEDDIGQLRTVLNLRDAQFDSAKIDNFVDAAGPASGRLLRDADPEIRDRVFDFDLDRFGDSGLPSDGLQGQFRRNVLKQSLDGASRQPPVTRYLDDLDRIGRGIDDGVEVDGADGLIREFAEDEFRGSFSSYEGQAFEARRVAEYVDEARTGDEVRSITVDFDAGRSGKDIDYRVERFNGNLNIEAKSPESDLKAENIRDFVDSADGKFTDLGDAIGPSERRILDIESRDNGGLVPGRDDEALRQGVQQAVRDLRDQKGRDVNVDLVCVVGADATTLVEIDGESVTLTADTSGVCT